MSGFDPVTSQRIFNLSHRLTRNLCDVIVDSFADSASAFARLDQIWKLRVCNNYAQRPAYFAISKIGQNPLVRFNVKRLGGHYLHLSDVGRNFAPELGQIRLALDTIHRSLPRWDVIREGYDRNCRAHVFFHHCPEPVRVEGSDRHSAVLAAWLTHNGIPRSIAEWQKIFSEDPLFRPRGGSFNVPSRNTLKMYIHRDFPKYLQKAFDRYRSGYSLAGVMEHMKLDAKTMGYNIRGVCLPINYADI